MTAPLANDPAAMRIVLSTCPADAAEALAQQLVAEQLAACVNVLPGLRSFYRWQGEVCTEPESQLVIKTTAAGYDALAQRLLALHPYTTPELVSLTPNAVHPPYLQWLLDSCLPPPPSPSSAP